MIGRARRRLAGEEGLSLVVAVCTMALLVVLAGTALQQGVQALTGANGNAHRKRALQAADAAVDAAIFRLNRADLGGALKIDPLDPTALGGSKLCVAGVGDPAALDLVPLPAGTPLDPRGRRWCPETDPETAGNEATFTYRVSELARVASGDCGGEGLLELDREVVAIGASGGHTRRVKARLRAAVALLSGSAVQSGSSTAPMVMSGTARVLGDVQSNHDIRGAATNVIAGRAIPGPGTPPHTVAGVVPVGSNAAACQRLVLPPVQQGDARTSNDNPAAGGLANRCLSAALLVTSCSVALLGTTGGVEWDATKRTLRVWGNGIASLTGDTYSFCRLRLEGQAILAIPNSSPVARIFMDEPQHCPGVTSPGQVTMDGTARFVNCHLQTQPQTLQVYAVGSSSAATTQTFAGAGSLSSTVLATLCGVSLPAAGTPMVIYAPRSKVLLGGSASVAGQVVGDTVEMSGAAAVQPVSALINLNQLGANPILPLYQPDSYVECTGDKTFHVLPVADPAQGC